MSRRVLITGARAPVALELARRFHRQGWDVHMADSSPAWTSRCSRAVARFHRVPPPRQAPAEFSGALARLVTTHGIDLLLPTCEEGFHIAGQRALLPAGLHMPLAPLETLRGLHSKWDFLDIARRCGAAPADSARVWSLDDAREWAGGDAVVLKPEYSRFGTHTRVYSAGITASAPALQECGPWVVQRYVAGTELCSHAVAVRGQLQVLQHYQPVHRLPGSASYYMRAVQAPQLDACMARLVADQAFDGQIGVDWIIDADGQPHALECNPRATSGLHLLPQDQDHALVAALCGETVPEAPAPLMRQAGVPLTHLDASAAQPAGDTAPAAMLAPMMYLHGLPQALRHGAWARWREDHAAAADILGWPGDRGPLLGAGLDLAILALRTLGGGPLRELATADLHWDGPAP